MAKVANAVPVATKRKTRKASAKRTPKPAAEHKCVCGCGGTTRRYFVPGHDARFKGWLTRIARGEASPAKMMGAKLAKAMGPFIKRGDGLTTKTTYQAAFGDR